MKKLPLLNQGFENLNKLFFESVRKNLMMTGIELKIFNLLSKSLTAEKIARSLNTDLQNTIHITKWKTKWKTKKTTLKAMRGMLIKKN